MEISKKTRTRLTILATLLSVIGAIIGGMATFYTEYLWFDHLAFSEVYITVLMSQVGTGVVFGLACFLALGLHIILIKRNSKPRSDWTIPTADGGEVDIREIVSRVTTPVVVAAALVVSAGMGYWASRHWEEVLRYLNQTPFGQADPVLNKDIGFYLFVLPTMQFTQEWLVYLAGLCLAISAGVYFLRGALQLDGYVIVATDKVRGHLLFGLACALLVLAWGWRIEMFETLFSKRGVAYGATYTDVYVNLNGYRVMMAACVTCAVYLLALIKIAPQGRKGTLMPAIGIASVVVFYILGTFVVPTAVQQFVVNPNELDKEKPYLTHAIEGTRAAYSLDKIKTTEFEANDDLAYEDITGARDTIDNIKIWDHRPLKATYKQMQVIRLYYDFPAISVDRYTAEDRMWQVMLSARELVPGQLPAQSQTWVNQHLQYTHGYGVCLSPVNRVVGEGLPDLWIKDIPPQSKYEHMKIARPEIYYGQATNDWVLVKTNTQEFDYPQGEENKYTTYAGDGGVGIGSFFRRVLFALRMQDVNILFTRYLTTESRILYNRNIQQRVQAVAPFLMLDQEPYMVVTEGRLKWIQDAYTISYRYPYSQPTSLGGRQRINYIRNSVKVVVDAFDGKMQLYIWDEVDPMVRTYAKMFPALFKNKGEMPADLATHVRYPKDLFSIQAIMYESFHMTDARIWYNQEDKWAVSRELAEKTTDRQADEATRGPGLTARHVTHGSRMAPYYMIMRLPQEKKEEFLLMVPFTPTNKDNMVAWLSARCDGDNYGKLLVYTFPKKKLIFGPMQIEARIDQDENISQWITLRNQQGSQVIRGDLLVIPIKDSILYVEPIYLQAIQTHLPELKQVIVAFGKKLTMKEDLRTALYEVFNVKSGNEKAADRAAARGEGPRGGAVLQDKDNVVPAGNAGQLLRRALSHYEDGKKKLAESDWAGYGASQRALKATLDQLANELKPALAPKPAPAPAAEL